MGGQNPPKIEKNLLDTVQQITIKSGNRILKITPDQKIIKKTVPKSYNTQTLWNIGLRQYSKQLWEPLKMMNTIYYTM